MRIANRIKIECFTKTDFNNLLYSVDLKLSTPNLDGHPQNFPQFRSQHTWKYRRVKLFFSLI